MPGELHVSENVHSTMESVPSSMHPFLPLVTLFGDEVVAGHFSERSQVQAWLRVEYALAETQAALGIIPAEAATAIVSEATIEKVNFERLRERTKIVGYPIMPLLDELSSQSSPEVGSYIHWGATTQDIMDTGLMLQMGPVVNRVKLLALDLGDILAARAHQHRATIMAGRTHAQQAVPISLGGKLAVWLAELDRHLHRLSDLYGRLLVVQLFGAGGTGAGFGPASKDVRHGVARLLDLGCVDVPWHTARDNIAEVGCVLAAMGSTCGKIAREVVDLSRSEIAEVREEVGWHRGASSTMPQKTNPIASEAVIGMSALAREHVPALLSAMVGNHERAAGEWQIEWDSLPLICTLVAGCLNLAGQILDKLQVFPDRMEANLAADGGMIMAEAVMMALAPVVGRDRSHELVYGACAQARHQGITLLESLRASLDEDLLARLPPLHGLLKPSHYVGESDGIVQAAIDQWRNNWRRDGVWDLAGEAADRPDGADDLLPARFLVE